MKALVTGSAGGIGRAIVAKLRGEGFEVAELDLVTGFDVTDPAAWERVGPVDLACLNAGVLTGSSAIEDLTDAQYRRLALLYLVASVRRGSWLIPGYHSAFDAGIKDAHDDPQNFELKEFAGALAKLLKDVR